MTEDDDLTAIEQNYALAIAALRYCQQQRIDLVKAMPNHFETDTPISFGQYDAAIDMLQDDKNWL